MRGRHRLLAALWLVALLGSGERADGGRYTDFSQAELRTLPRPCLAQRFINDELDSPAVSERRRAELAAKLGRSFHHYHHYCWALLYMRRAARPGGDEFNYRQAVDNLNYVIARAEPGFRLLAGVYFKKGNVLERLGERQAAAEEYRNALRVDPGHAAACVALAQSYLDRGDDQAARAALAEGLKHAPGSKTLAAKQADLERRERERR
jgi:tetratricopeptide (TPR) repeat protein